MVFNNKILRILNLTQRRFQNIFFDDKSPFVASLKLTQRCNLHCRHCTWYNKIKNDLTLQQWKIIIDNIYKMGCLVIFLEGGEPTLRKDINEIINYIKSKGMGCVLFTNGTGHIPEEEVDAVWISIDGIENTHNSIRGEGVYQKVMDTIDRYPDLNMYSITALSKISKDEIDELCFQLSSTNLKGHIFNFMYPYKDIEQEVLNKNERIEMANRILDLKNKYPKIISSDSYLKSVGQPNKLCYPWILALVTADGKITQGCTIEPVEKADCDKCDMMCGIEATLGIELNNDSVHFWNYFNILNDFNIDLFPDWATNFFRIQKQ